MSNPNPAEALRPVVKAVAALAEGMRSIAEALSQEYGRDAYALAPTPDPAEDIDDWGDAPTTRPTAFADDVAAECRIQLAKLGDEHPSTIAHDLIDHAGRTLATEEPAELLAELARIAGACAAWASRIDGADAPTDASPTPDDDYRQQIEHALANAATSLTADEPQSVRVYGLMCNLADAVLAVRDRRIEQLLARISTLEHVAQGNKRHVQIIAPELEQAQAAIARVRTIKKSPGRSRSNLHANAQDDGWDQALDAVHAALDDPLTPAAAPDVEADNEQLRARLDRVIKQRDQAAALIAAVRVLHGPATHNGRQICATCSAYDGLSCDSTPVPYSECATLAVLDGRLVPAETPLTPAAEPGPACPSCSTSGAFIGKPLHRRDCPNRPTGPTLDIACALPWDGPADA
jgi:hypothetical protein